LKTTKYATIKIIGRSAGLLFLQLMQRADVVGRSALKVSIAFNTFPQFIPEKVVKWAPSLFSDKLSSRSIYEHFS